MSPMKKSFPLLVCASLGVAGFLTGCDTFKARSNEKSEVFDSLPTATQKRLERGKINVGDTQDMVYIALGHPDETREISTADGEQPVWVYKTYWQQYEGTAWVGWHRVIVPAANGRGYVVFHEPVTQDIYRTRVDEVIRVAFSRNMVSAVEQQKR